MSDYHDPLPPEVREAIRKFLHDHEPGDRIAMSTAIVAILQAYPDLNLRDEDVADAIAGDRTGAYA
jgi:hypothetical protein